MKVNPSFEHTRAAAVPEGWDAKTLGDFVSLQRGHDLTDRERRPGNIPVLGSAGENGFHDTALVKGPGVVLGRSGASFGQAHFCEQDFWPHNTALYVTDFHGNDWLFAFYLLKGLDFSRHNSGGAQQSLNRNFIAPIPVAVPRLHEQQAIAEALSDADALVESLEQLLAKKRHLKQGAMQVLLTGKKRLPGFGDKWKVTTLGDVVEVRKGESITKDSSVPGPVPVIAGGRTPSHYHNVANRPGNTIAISGSGANAGYVSFHERPIFASDCSTISEGATYSVKFIYFALLVRQPTIYESQTGGAQPHVHPSDLRPLALDLPPTTAEQVAIGTILSDMDAEIAALGTKLAKTRLVKQGMMQELLTGRTRLV